MMSDGVILKMFHIHGMQFRDAMMTQDPLKKNQLKIARPGDSTSRKSWVHTASRCNLYM